MKGNSLSNFGRQSPKENIPVKLFHNLSTDLAEEIF